MDKDNVLKEDKVFDKKKHENISKTETKFADKLLTKLGKYDVKDDVVVYSKTTG